MTHPHHHAEAEGGAAFPSANDVHFAGGGTAGHKGMSLRDYFAGQALVGQVQIEDNRTYDKTCGFTLEEWRKSCRESDAAHCYLLADAMLTARSVSAPAKE